MPTVSVIIPTYNSAAYLADAIESVLAQTFRDIELIVIDDGSTDHTDQVMSAYVSQVMYIRQVNQGPSAARNVGIRSSTGAYLAFLDSDDIAMPDRLARQVGFLKEHPEIGLVGSLAEFVDLQGDRLGTMQVPLEDLEIRWTCLLLNPFIHSTLMVRRELVNEHALAYNPDLSFAEDYELWSCALAFTQAANLDQCLVKYRVRGDSFTITGYQDRLENHARIACRVLQQMLPSSAMTLEQVRSLCSLLLADPKTYARFGLQRGALIEEYLNLWEAFAERNRGAPNIQPLQRKVVLKAARMLLFPYPSQGWSRILAKFSKIEKDWPWHFIASLPNAFSKQVQRYKFANLRN